MGVAQGRGGADGLNRARTPIIRPRKVAERSVAASSPTGAPATSGPGRWQATAQCLIASAIARGLLPVETGASPRLSAPSAGRGSKGAERRPVILSGMIGSRRGWKEAPYLAAPVSLDALAKQSLPPGRGGRRSMVSIVPGVSLERSRRTRRDARRGDQDPGGAPHRSAGRSGSFLLPGTHSKWAMVKRRPARVLPHLHDRRGLRPVAQAAAPSPSSSRARRSTRRPCAAGSSAPRPAPGRDLLHALFGDARPEPARPAAGLEVAGYLSGLLIGSELSRRAGLAPASRQARRTGRHRRAGDARELSPCGSGLRPRPRRAR